MSYSKISIIASVVTMAFVAASAALAFSPNDYSLFGTGHYISPGEASNRAVQLNSDSSGTYGGIDYGLGGTYTFADIHHLSTDYKFEAGSCGGGAPRFQINVQTPSGSVKNIFVYIGPPPSYAGCPMGVWTSSGELVGGLMDTSQLPGGTFYDPYASVLAKYGSYPVVGIQLVTDAGWAFPATGQTVDVDNTVINSTLYTYEIPVATSKDQCKDGGWKNYADNNGHAFKNQGDCVSFVASGGKNQGNG